MNRFEEILPIIECNCSTGYCKCYPFVDLRLNFIESLRKAESEGKICFIPAEDDIYKKIYPILSDYYMADNIRILLCKKMSNEILKLLRGTNDKTRKIT